MFRIGNADRCAISHQVQHTVEQVRKVNHPSRSEVVSTSTSDGSGPFPPAPNFSRAPSLLAALSEPEKSQMGVSSNYTTSCAQRWRPPPQLITHPQQRRLPGGLGFSSSGFVSGKKQKLSVALVSCIAGTDPSCRREASLARHPPAWVDVGCSPRRRSALQAGAWQKETIAALVSFYLLFAASRIPQCYPKGDADRPHGFLNKPPNTLQIPGPRNERQRHRQHTRAPPCAVWMGVSLAHTQ